MHDFEIYPSKSNLWTFSFLLLNFGEMSPHWFSQSKLGNIGRNAAICRSTAIRKLQPKSFDQLSRVLHAIIIQYSGPIGESLWNELARNSVLSRIEHNRKFRPQVRARSNANHSWVLGPSCQSSRLKQSVGRNSIEGREPWIFVQDTFATTTGNFERDPEPTGCQNTPRTSLQTIKAQRTALERNFMESRDRKHS